MHRNRIKNVYDIIQSNENMELMTKLQSEQHIIKELSTRLTQQEEELEEIRAVVSNKLLVIIRNF